MNKINYGKHLITDEDIDAVISVLKSDYLTQGPQVELFENAFAKYVGSKYAVAVSNATAGLHIACLSLGLKPGDKVLTTPISFVASSNCAAYCGADIEFVDIDPATLCIDYNLLEEKLSKNPKTYKGIIAVDFAGYPLNMEKFKNLAKKYDMWIIEDACHAVGAEFKNSHGEWKKSGGGDADVSVFSFHPVKHIATAEGGMLTTNNPEVYESLKLLRSHGITKDISKMSKSDGPWYYEMQTLGYNYRMPDLLCTLGASQLKRMDSNLNRRREVADIYKSEFSSLNLISTERSQDIKHAYHLYVVQTENREELFNYLKEHNIYAQIHYIPIYKQPFYINKYGPQSLKNAEAYYDGCISLPMYHSLSEQELNHTINTVKKFFKKL